MGEPATDLQATPSASRANRLLLVDDEENILRSIKRVLRRGNWEIETATDGRSGVETFERFQPAVVVSDFRMPGMNGVEFLSRVKELAPRAQRIMLTGHADHQAIEEAINRSEVFRFLSKPWNDQQLMLTVQSAFEQFDLLTENDRLHRLARERAEQLEHLNADLETRVALRTQMLAVAKREWELSFDSIDLPMAIVRRDHGVKRANVAYSRAAGRDIQTVAGHPRCHEFLFGRKQPCPQCPLEDALEHGRDGRAEIAHDDRTYVLSVYPMTQDGQAVCSYRDVTEERLMTRRLVENEKMAAVGQLAGGVAHEINNPLGGILAFAQLMQRDAGRSQADLESLQLIEESAIRCKRIVESLLRFSRRSRGEDRRLFALNRCVEDAVLLFRAQLKSAPKARLDISLEDELPEVFGDAAQLGQVVLNLLQNGLYALPEQEGTLRVTTGTRDGGVLVKVEDTGTGIAPEHLPHIFEPHFTTKPPGEGTGLGLSIAYRIVNDHGGEFEVDTTVGTGTTFTILLPVPPPGMP